MLNNIESLPVEVTEIIFVFSKNTNLSLCSRHLFSVCSLPTNRAKLLLHQLGLIPTHVIHNLCQPTTTRHLSRNRVSWHTVFEHRLFDSEVAIAIVRLKSFVDEDYISLLLAWCVSKGILNLIEILYTEKLLSQALLDSAIIDASVNGLSDVVNLLIIFGADVHTETDSPICMAAKYGHLGIVQSLLDAGADLNAADGFPLAYSTKNGHISVVKRLIDNGADISVRNDVCIKWACEYGYKNIATMFLQHNANPTTEECYALRWASTRGHTDCVKLLLGWPGIIDIHAMDDYALRQAVKFRHVDIVRLLCDAGANVHAQNDEAFTWSRLDKSPESKEILELLTR